MNRRIIRTADGSASIQWTELDETYHSRHGAIQESLHVFLKMGMEIMPKNEPLSILEVGWGTGLNTLLTIHHSQQHKASISYTAIEAYPLELEQVQQLDYCNDSLKYLEPQFLTMHNADWDIPLTIVPDFTFCKYLNKLQNMQFEPQQFNLIYFDAFGPRTQPELWMPWVWEKMYACLKPGGVLVTYCAKGQVRRDMQDAGFSVERLPGAPGKREMLRATK